ncbi:Egf Domain-Specific O-Linked N-Acetylglucosamine Transferase [Manis pentadactyla]|nr:Egf Domain-Specific O-Linked N-Acetylglucosamine Transferase [Manis pentadactyla]
MKGDDSPDERSLERQPFRGIQQDVSQRLPELNFDSDVKCTFTRELCRATLDYRGTAIRWADVCENLAEPRCFALLSLGRGLSRLCWRQETSAITSESGLQHLVVGDANALTILWAS